MTRAYLALGSNLGERSANLDRAVARIADVAGISASRVSSYYETAPEGKTDQPDFVNAVVEIETTLTAQQLLSETQRIERQLGRVRTERWGPRTIDIDVLTFGDACLETEDLRVPHPRMRERLFVLEPLAELAPDLRVPGETRTVSEILRSRKLSVRP